MTVKDVVIQERFYSTCPVSMVLKCKAEILTAGKELFCCLLTLCRSVVEFPRTDRINIYEIYYNGLQAIVRTV